MQDVSHMLKNIIFSSSTDHARVFATEVQEKYLHDVKQNAIKFTAAHSNGNARKEFSSSGSFYCLLKILPNENSVRCCRFNKKIYRFRSSAHKAICNIPL